MIENPESRSMEVELAEASFILQNAAGELPELKTQAAASVELTAVATQLEEELGSLTAQEAEMKNVQL